MFAASEALIGRIYLGRSLRRMRQTARKCFSQNFRSRRVSLCFAIISFSRKWIRKELNWEETHFLECFEYSKEIFLCTFEINNSLWCVITKKVKSVWFMVKKFWEVWKNFWICCYIEEWNGDEGVVKGAMIVEKFICNLQCFSGESTSFRGEVIYKFKEEFIIENKIFLH